MSVAEVLLMNTFLTRWNTTRRELYLLLGRHCDAVVEQDLSAAFTWKPVEISLCKVLSEFSAAELLFVEPIRVQWESGAAVQRR